MANTIEIMLLDNKRAEAMHKNQPIAIEGGYKIIAGEDNATIFELKSAPEQYKNDSFKVVGYNAGHRKVDLSDNMRVGDTFALPLGMAIAGYSQLIISCVHDNPESLDDEVVFWLPVKFKVYNTMPDWAAASEEIDPEVLHGIEEQIRLIEIKLENLDVDIPDATTTEKGILTLGSKGGAAKYEDLETLKEQIGDLTYKAPTTTLSLTGDTRSVDLTLDDDLTRTITGFSHRETNIENIRGQLQFKYSTTTQSVDKSSVNKSETLSSNITVTFSSSVRSATFTLSGTSVKNAAFSDTASITSFYPSYYGALESNPTASTITTLTKWANSSLYGTHTTTVSGGNKYIWFCTTSSISKITSSGFDVPFTQDGTLSYKGGSYNLYRTSNLIAAGTHTFSIS